MCLLKADADEDGVGGDDAVGRRVAETNQDNVVTRFGYDGAGRLLAVTNAFGKPEQTWALYSHDEAGNQTAQIDALNRTNRYEFDNLGRRTKHTLPGNQMETFGYDLLGNLIRHTNFNGVVLTNQYDVMNRLTNRSSTNGYNISYAYAVTGQRTNMSDASGTTSYFFDVRDRLTNCVSPAGELQYSYDANGNLTNISSKTAGGTLAAYQFDPLNRLTNVVDGRLAGTQNTAYGFDALGNVQRMTYPNGITNLFQYDLLNRLTNLTWKYNNGDPRADFAYKLGSTGNRTNLSETITAGSVVLRTNAWQYDALYRLTNEVITGATAGNLTYGFDLVGNRTNRGGSLLSAQTPTYNTNDWVKTDAYDSNGNTLWSTNGTATGPYYYDVENRLTGFNGVTITYNGDGQRVKKVAGGVTTLYLVDGLNPSGYAQVLEELTAGVGTNFYTYGLDLISQRSPLDSTNFFGYDGHGSTRFLVNASGTVVNAFAYDAYGTLIASNGPAQTAYLYCGEQFDTHLGFYYLRARYLNPNTGRFWTMDDAEGDQEDTKSLHLYLYCADNPVNLSDASGNEFEIGGLLNVMSIASMLYAQLSPVTPQVLQRARSIGGRDVDVYIWRWQGTGIMWPGSRVGHVMLTEAGTQHVYLSQFPHAFGAPSSPKGPNTKLNWSETVSEEGSTPDNVFRVHLPNETAFDAAVKDHVSRKTWVANPKTKNQTHCARAGYDALKAGGLPVKGQDTGQALPGTLGDILQKMSKAPTPNGATWSIKVISTDYNKIITR